ncbi:MAG TPA: hypothetical protein PLZ86_00435 [bacterium]|nr:hypothetical protein [bacterium]
MSKTICPVDRHNIKDLAKLLELSNASGGPSPKLAKEDIAEVLSRSVNLPGDKLSKEHKRSFSAENSVSAFEAFSFIKKLMVTGQISGASTYAQIGRGLDRIFFGGELLSKLPGGHPIVISKCHDADTCTFMEEQPATCNAGPSTVSVRISGIDAPEVGYYSERLADSTRGKGSPYAKAPSFLEPISGWINSKLVSNVDAIHVALSKGLWNPKQITYKEREAINNIIAATIEYTGKMATVPRSDLLSWESDQMIAGAAHLMESQVRWTSADTPKVLCGTWQPFDIYGRRIASFLQRDESRLDRYMRTRLSTVMAAAAPALRADYNKRVARFVATIEKSRNGKLKEAVKGIVENIPDAGKIYSKDNCAKMADIFSSVVKKFGGQGADDDQLMQVVIGSVYPYLKYRNQRGDLYEEGGKLAREQGLGLWKETTFRTLWEVNAKKSRYSPPDCCKK